MKVIAYNPPKQAWRVEPGRAPTQSFNVSTVEVHFINDGKEALVSSQRYMRSLLPIPVDQLASTKEKALAMVAAQMDVLFPAAPESRPPLTTTAGKTDSSAAKSQPEPVTA